MSHVISRILRAGLPTTIALAGTSRVTTAPAPMIAPCPMWRRGRMMAPVPMNAHSSTTTSPARRAPGAICAPSPTTQSWSIEDAVLTMTERPSFAFAQTAARARTWQPSPYVAVAATKELRWMMDGRKSSCDRKRSAICSLLLPSVPPMATTPAILSTSPCACSQWTKPSVPTKSGTSLKGEGMGRRSKIAEMRHSWGSRASRTTPACPVPPHTTMGRAFIV